jgi:hypothetical protein
MSMETNIVLRKVKFPRIGHPEEPRPEIPASVFAGRLKKTRKRMAERELDALVVYGDREHFANLAYLTNYDPRFEESLLIIFPSGKPILFVGNEGWGYSNIARLDIERRLCQTLSLQGQPREKVQQFHLMLKETGLRKCRRVGAAGWKYFSEDEVEGGAKVLDLPEYMATSLRRAVSARAVITNETAIFTDAEKGLRNINEPEQLAYFEWVATNNSENLLQGIRALKPGMTEFEVFEKMPSNGTPFSCGPAIAAGENLRRFFMSSATNRRVRLGDPMLIGYSYQGACTCRLGYVAHGPRDLPKDASDYFEEAVLPYFVGLKAWYETFCIGATGDDLHHAVIDRMEPLGFTFNLNIGHQTAMDEWTNSPVAPGSMQKVHSGMYWQVDFYPVLPTGHPGTYAEDGIAVADASLQKTLAARYPKMWKRIQARRQFMVKTLGYRLSHEILPFSNICGAVIPYLLSPDLCPVAVR